MFFLELLLCYLLIYIGLFLSGWGISDLLCKGRSSTYKALLSPIIGILPLSIISMYFSVAGVNAAIGGGVAFVSSVSLTMYLMRRTPPFFKQRNGHSPLIIVFILLSAFPSFAVILKSGHLTSTLQSYSTFVTYPADYFSSFSYLQKISPDFDKPITSTLSDIFEYDEILAHFFFVSAVSGLFGLPAYKIYLTLSAVVSSLLPISVYIACREGFDLEERPALLTSFLAAINYSFYFWAFGGQLPNIMGIVFLILAIGFLPAMLECRNWREGILYTLVVAGILSAYHMLIPYLLGIAILYISYQRGVPGDRWRACKNIFWIALGTVLVNPFTYNFLIRHGLDYSTVTSQFTHNIIRKPFIEELLGFGLHFTMRRDSSMFSKFAIAAASVLSAFSITGLYAYFKKQHVLALSSITFVFSLACYFYAVDYRYHFYKNSIIGVFLILLTIVAGAVWIYRQSISRWVRLAVIVMFLVWIGSNLYSLYFYSIVGTQPMIDPPLSNVYKLTSEVEEDQRILVLSDNPTEEAWISYFLQGNKIKLSGAVEPWGFWVLAPYTGRPNVKYFYDPMEDSIDFTLTRKIPERPDIVHTQLGETIDQNDEYILTRNLPHMALLRGWHGPEKDEDGPFRWTDQGFSFLFNRPKTDSTLRIQAVVPKVYLEPTHITIHLNGFLVDKFRSGPGLINKLYSLKYYALKDFGNVVTIRLNQSFVPNERWGTPDLRRLGIGIRTIELISGSEAMPDLPSEHQP